MSNAQTWTLIGGFFGILVAMNGLVLAIVRSETTALRRELIARFDGLREEMVARFEAVYRELRHHAGD